VVLGWGGVEGRLGEWFGQLIDGQQGGGSMPRNAGRPASQPLGSRWQVATPKGPRCTYCPASPHQPCCLHLACSDLPAGKAARVNLVQTQPFASTFGKQATRKRPKLGADSYSDMLHMVGGAGWTGRFGMAWLPAPGRLVMHSGNALCCGLQQGRHHMLLWVTECLHSSAPPVPAGGYDRGAVCREEGCPYSALPPAWHSRTHRTPFHEPTPAGGHHGGAVR